MGLIFDAGAARLYQAWSLSPHGRAVERLVKESVFTLLDPQPGERILDIGCGEGNHLRLFSGSGLNLAGLDASPYMVGRARDHLGHRAALEVGKAEDLPYQDNEFDLALFINTFEFLEDPIEALREAGRVARRGVFIAVTNTLSWYWFCVTLKNLFQKSLFARGRSFHLWELKAIARAALGDVPIKWRSAQVMAPVLEKLGGRLSERWYQERCPFGAFLGVSATLHYTVRTIQTPLKVPLRQAGQPVVRGVTMGDARNERSLPL
jgi:SAM-dependent methyltransferase